MTKITTQFLQNFSAERSNLILFAPVFIGFGAAFYFLFEENFLHHLSFCAALFFAATLFYFLNRYSSRCFIFAACSLFLAGSFYGFFYQKTFLNHTEITGKIYVDGIGKILAVQKFINPVNGVSGANLVISEPKLYKSKFVEKKKKAKKKKAKKNKKTKKAKKDKKPKKPKKSRQKSQLSEENVTSLNAITNCHSEPDEGSQATNSEQQTAEIIPCVQDNNVSEEAITTKPAKKKYKKRKKNKSTSEETVNPLNTTNCNNESGEGSSEIISCAQNNNVSEEAIPKKTKKKKSKKPKKKKPISEKTIQKNFVNLAGYQEIDREFLDYAKNYQQVEWLRIADREAFPHPPQKISLNIIKNSAQLKVNDVIAFRAMLQPPKAREFPDDFDFNLDAKFKKIGAYGFVMGEAKIVREAEISKLDDWFLQLREIIRSKILNSMKGDEAAIAQAFLIGDQKVISKDMMQKIRNSGLAHLLSISGFHLSLASAICFVGVRFILSRSEYLALRFDLKKFAAIAAIIGTFFYLKIAASPLPAQRAFVMVVLVLLALFIGEKINAKRAVMFAALCLVLANPLAVFNISFQLTFAAILVLISYQKNSARDDYFLLKVLKYFLHIILLSLLIQIATAPFLMHSFHNLSLLGFVANILAIPLTSFLVMPLGFLALFLMIFSWEKFALILFSKSILLIEKIAEMVSGFELSSFLFPAISGSGLVLAIVGLLIFCLLQTRLRFLGIAIFALSFATILHDEKPDILFESHQKFFAVRTSEGLIFSENLKASKQRKSWMDKMNEKEFKSLITNPQRDIFCEENFCEINKNKKFLVLLKRNKISEICKNDSDVIVNLTAKYKLPDCFGDDVIKIDNGDFYKKGAQFFRYDGSVFTF